MYMNLADLMLDVSRFVLGSMKQDMLLAILMEEHHMIYRDMCAKRWFSQWKCNEELQLPVVTCYHWILTPLLHC